MSTPTCQSDSIKNIMYLTFKTIQGGSVMLKMSNQQILCYIISGMTMYLTSSMQNSEAALINVAGTTTQWQSSHSTTGNARCHSTKIRDVNRV
jgi:hypothetical protein